MDGDFLVGCLCALLALLGVITGVVVGTTIHTGQQIKFEQVCVNSGRNVVYAEVDGSLVSECK